MVSESAVLLFVLCMFCGVIFLYETYHICLLHKSILVKKIQLIVGFLCNLGGGGFLCEFILLEFLDE